MNNNCRSACESKQPQKHTNVGTTNKHSIKSHTLKLNLFFTNKRFISRITEIITNVFFCPNFTFLEYSLLNLNHRFKSTKSTFYQ